MHRWGCDQFDLKLTIGTLRSARDAFTNRLNATHGEDARKQLKDRRRRRAFDNLPQRLRIRRRAVSDDGKDFEERFDGVH